MRREIEACQETVRAATGEAPRRYRPPVGLRNPAVHPACSALGLEVTGWQVRSLDKTRRTPEAVVALRALRRAGEGHDWLRGVVGVGKPGEIYLLAVWATRDGPRRLLSSPAFGSLQRRFPTGLWANEWLPENEFGHWDGVRLRKARERYSIAVPRIAMDVAGDRPLRGA